MHRKNLLPVDELKNLWKEMVFPSRIKIYNDRYKVRRTMPHNIHADNSIITNRPPLRNEVLGGRRATSQRGLNLPRIDFRSTSSSLHGPLLYLTDISVLNFILNYYAGGKSQYSYRLNTTIFNYLVKWVGGNRIKSIDLTEFKAYLVE